MAYMKRLAMALEEAKREGWSPWIRNGHDRLAVLNGCRFSIEHAEHVRRFFKRYLRHSKGNEWANKPFELLPWQWDNVIGPMFGWLRADGQRRFRKVYVEIPKKNGKSTIGAGLGLYLLLGDGEAGAEVYAAATKRDQACYVQDEAIRMVKASSELLRCLRINYGTKAITHEATNSKFAPLPADPSGTEGLNIHGLIMDELHVWTKRTFWDALLYGDAVRTQPMTFIITTAGVFDKTSLGWQEHEYAERWLKGDVEDDQYFAYICCADKEDDIADPKVHKKANPSYGVLIDPMEMNRKAIRAKEIPSERFNFMRRRLNIWTEAASSWLDMTKWDACDGPVDESELAGRTCYGGLDLASRSDLTTFVLLFPPEEEDSKWIVLPRFWLPQETATLRARQDKVKYLTWAESGHLTLTDGGGADYNAVLIQVRKDVAQFDLRSIGFDDWNAKSFIDELDPDGEHCVSFGQNFRDMSPPCKELEALVANGALVHGGHPVLRWNVANVKILTDTNGNVRPSKKHSTEKIDGVVGLIMALGRAMVGDEEGPSVYETRGVLRI